MDLTQVLSALNAASGTTAGSAGQLRNAFGESKAAITQGGEADLRLNAAQGVIETQKAQGMLAAQRNSQQFAQSAGMDISSEGQIATTLGAILKQSAMQVAQQSQKVNQISANSDLLSNPAGFLYDLLYGDAERSKLEGAAQQFDAVSAVLGKLNSATQQTTQTQEAIATVHTDATVAATQEQAAANAARLAADTRLKLATADVSMIQALDTMQARQASLAMQAYNVQVADENRKWQREIRDEALAAKKQETEAEEEILNMWNKVAPDFGAPTFSNSKAFKTFRTTMPAERLQYIMDRAAEAHYSPDNSYRVASDPIQAIVARDALGIRFNPAQNNVLDKLSSKAAPAITLPGITEVLRARGVDEKTAGTMAMQILEDKKQHPTIMREYLALQLDSMSKVVNPGDATNIFAPPDMSAFAGKPILTSNKFLDKYISPLTLGTQAAAFDPTVFVTKAVEAVAAGDVTVQEISDGLAGLGSAAMLTNNATIQYHKALGINPPKQLNMPVKINRSALFGPNSKVIDVTDPTAWTIIINDALAASKTPAVNFRGTNFQR